MKTVVEAWRARPERERSLLGAGALVVGVMLYVALVWLPLERTRVRLAADLPALRASIAALERDAAEVKRLRAIPSAIPRNPMPLASLMSMNAWAKRVLFETPSSRAPSLAASMNSGMTSMPIVRSHSGLSAACSPNHPRQQPMSSRLVSFSG